MPKGKKFNAKPLAVIVILALVVGGGIMFLGGKEKNYYDFASCMASTGLQEIGSDSCLHCENEKRIIGHDAFKKNFDDVGNYYRCNFDPLFCSELGIRGTPTWYMPSASGKQISAQGSMYSLSGTYTEYLGEKTISELAQITGCALPADYDLTVAPAAGGYTGA